MLSEFILPRLGSRPIHEITAPELLHALRAIESRGTHETARRTKQYVGQVFRFAIATGRAESRARSRTESSRSASPSMHRPNTSTLQGRRSLDTHPPH